MNGFQSPNYTQTPNDFFALLPLMNDAELRVTLVMIRHTFGYHRDSFKMGVSKLAKAAGLSRQGALDGAKEAEVRGTFRRTNPDTQGEAEWELTVNDVEPLQPVDAPLQPVEGTPPISRGQVGLNKDKEIIKIDIYTPAPQKTEPHKDPVIQAMLSQGMFPNATTPDFLETWREKHTDERIIQAVQLSKGKVQKYVDSILVGWEANGYPLTREERIEAARKTPQQQFRPTLEEKQRRLLAWAEQGAD